jgi:hypothetical protein
MKRPFIYYSASRLNMAVLITGGISLARFKTYFKLTAIDLSRHYHAHDVLKL